MSKLYRAYNWLVVVYAAAFILYLFNLATPPNNMPIFIVMAVIAVTTLVISRDKKRAVLALLLIGASVFLVVKEHNDGVALKSRVDKARQHSQQ